MELYFARCGRKRAYIVAPTRARAQELADQLLAVPSRGASLTYVDDDLIVDTAGVADAPPISTRSKR